MVRKFNTLKTHNLVSIEKYLPKECILYGNKNLLFDNIQTAENVNKMSLDWVNHTRQNKIEYIQNSKANIVICQIELKDELLEIANKLLILVPNPKLTFLTIANKLFVPKIQTGIHNTAVINKDALIGENCFVGPNTVIGKCKIHNNTIIKSNCSISDGVVIGEHVLIHPGVVIGSDGFGYQRNDDNILQKFPHIGGVIIENHVEIGANSCIDRGALGNTIIKSGSKIDNMVHIAHNVKIGKNTVVIANTMIAGSVVIGNDCWIAPSVSIRDNLNIGNNVQVGMSSLVTKDIPDNEVWLGIPAKKLPIKNFK